MGKGPTVGRVKSGGEYNNHRHTGDRKATGTGIHQGKGKE